MSGLVLCTADPHLAEFLQATARRAAMPVTLVEQPSQGMRVLGELSPDVILLDEQFHQGAALEFAANVLTMLPHAKVVLLLRAHNFELVRAAMRLGLADALMVPDELDRLPDLLSRLSQARADRAAAGRVLAFFRAKGGVGATFLAVNTAVVATELVGGKVLLIDGNLLTSDVPAMLNLKAQRTILDLAPVLGELTPRHIEDVCAHHASGLHVLMAVGEVCGEEALDMLQAMNTGHEGSLTTIHANSPQDALRRLEAMVTMSGAQLPVRVLREHLVAALNIVVQTQRFEDGSRQVVAIDEVRGVGESGELQVVPVFRFERTGVDAEGRVAGEFRTAPEPPACLRRMRGYGVHAELGPLLAYWGEGP